MMTSLSLSFENKRYHMRLISCPFLSISVPISLVPLASYYHNHWYLNNVTFRGIDVFRSSGLIDENLAS